MTSTARLAPFLLFGAAFVVYLAALDASFIFDDIPNIVSNPAVQPQSFHELIASLLARGHEGAFYIDNRPVAMFTFALNYLAHGMTPTGFILVNIVIHAVNGILLFSIIYLLPLPAKQGVTPERQARFAFWAALLWLLHPVNTQAVTYIVQRMTSLAALGFLLGMLVFVLWRLGKIRGAFAWPLIVLAYALALGSKGHAVTLPAVLLLMDWAFFRQWSRWHWAAAGALLSGAALLTVLYLQARVGLWEVLPRRDYTAYERVLTQGRVLWHYLSLWFWPDPARLHLDYFHYPASRGWLNPWHTLFAWASLAGLAALALATIRRHPWPGFAFLFFLLTSSIEASVLNLELVFEHRVYLPASFLFAGLLVFVLPRIERLTTTLMLLLLMIALALGTIERNRQWGDTGGFWFAEFEASGESHRAAINASHRYLQQGRPSEALSVIQRVSGTTNLRVDHWILLATNEANALYGIGDYVAAEARFREIMEWLPMNPRLTYLLGLALVQQEKLDEAQMLVSDMSERMGDQPYIVSLHAVIRMHENDHEGAARVITEYLREAELPRPAHEVLLRLHLADAYRGADEPELAIAQYRQIVDLDASNWAAWSQILFMLESAGEDTRANHVRRYLEERGVDPEGWR